MKCLEPETILSMLERRLDPSRRDAVDRHVDECPACRTLLSAAFRAESSPPPDYELESTVAGRRRPTSTSSGGSSSADLASPRTPRQDRYTGLRPLAAGGMGVVWRAVRLSDGLTVALKTLERLDPDRRSRFVSEAAAIQAIDHPNVVRVLDVGETEDSEPYLAMEWLEGLDLAHRLDHSTVDPFETALIGCAVADGLQAAHDRGVIHRDVKPANVFLCRGGAVKILDFGLALFAGASPIEHATGVGLLVGTPAFMAPEQVAASRSEDVTTDVWGLGATLYCAVAGRTPFRADSLALQADRILHDEPDPLPPDVPEWLAEILLRALRKDPRARFAGAREMGEALRRGLGRTSRPPSSTPADGAALVEEVRFVAVLYAEGVNEASALAAMIESANGLARSLPARGLCGIFGVEQWGGDEPERALRVALRARDDGIAGRFGVATGRAVRGPVGELVDEVLASAVSVARNDGVGVDPETLRRVQGEFELGGDRVLAARPTSSEESSAPEFDAAEAPLVGREAELALLGAALAGVAEQGSATGWLLTGGAGVGKSRLVDALARTMASEHPGATAIVCNAEAHRTLEGWHALRGAVRRHFDLSSETPPEQAREVLLTGCPSAACAEGIGELVGARFLESPRLSHARSHVQHMQDLIVVSLGEWLESLARRGPLLLALEDAQWADRQTLAAFETLVAILESSPAFFIATEREGAPDRLPGFRRLEIGPLPRDATRRLIGAVLPAALDGLADELFERAGGNPYLTLELAQAHREGKPGLPASVETAMQGRLDALPAPLKDLVRRASVLGRTFTADALRGLGAPSPEIDLEELRRRGLVTFDRSGAARAWRFRHALLSEVAYSSLTAEQRASLHATATVVLASSPGTPAAEIARHLEAAGRPEAAIVEWRRALDDARRAADGTSALAAADRLLGTAVSRADELAMRESRLEALIFLGRGAEAMPDADRILALSATASERAHALGLRSWLSSRASRWDEALELLAEARSLDPETPEIAIRQSWASLLAGRITDAAAWASDAVSVATRRAPGSVLWGRALTVRAHCALHQGDHGRASADLDGALEAYERVGDTRRIAIALGSQGYAALWAGRLEAARALLHEARKAARSVGYRSEEISARHNLGMVLALGGDLRAALREEDEALAQARAIGATRLAANCLKYRTWILVERGELDDARRSLAELSALEGLGSLAPEVSALEATVLLGESQIDRARAVAEEGLALRSAQGGMEELEGDLLLAAHLAGVPGALAEGLAMLAARASTILPPAARAGYLERWPAHARLRALGRAAGLAVPESVADEVP